MPPSIHNSMDHMGHRSVNGAAVASATPKKEEVDRRNSALFGDVPESKRRKFILVDDPVRNSRVRVRVMLDQVEMNEIPDSYRKTNSVYPRAYFPMQMQDGSDSIRGNRFIGSDAHDDDDGQPIVGKTLVPIPVSESAEGKVAVPRISRAKRSKEDNLNDLGYRMSWSQSRTFAGRTIFLQRSRKCHLPSGEEFPVVDPYTQSINTG